MVCTVSKNFSLGKLLRKKKQIEKNPCCKWTMLLLNITSLKERIKLQISWFLLAVFNLKPSWIWAQLSAFVEAKLNCHCYSQQTTETCTKSQVLSVGFSSDKDHFWYLTRSTVSILLHQNTQPKEACQRILLSQSLMFSHFQHDTSDKCFSDIERCAALYIESSSTTSYGSDTKCDGKPNMITSWSRVHTFLSMCQNFPH